MRAAVRWRGLRVWSFPEAVELNKALRSTAALRIVAMSQIRDDQRPIQTTPIGPTVFHIAQPRSIAASVGKFAMLQILVHRQSSLLSLGGH